MARLTDIRLRRSAVSGSIPTTTNLNLGELALNTADGKLYMKKSVGGTDSIVEVGAESGGIASTFTAYEYTATSSQTTFSGTDNNSNTLAYNTGTPAKVQVFMNGILLDEGSSADYTASNGTSVVLTTAADAGDLIQIHAYKSDVSVSSNLSFGDNIKLQFGDSQDLEIYHDGSNSYVSENSTGNLYLQGTHVYLRKGDGAENYIDCIANGAVTLRYDNAAKLATTSTGIDVTGSVTSTTGFTTSGTLTQFNTYNSASTLLGINIVSDAGSTSYTHPYLDFRRWTGSGTNHYTASIEVAPTNADANAIVFMSDTKSTNTKATTERMRIDSSGNVGIGATNPGALFEIASSNPKMRITDTDGGYSEVRGAGSNLVLVADAGNSVGSTYVAFETDGSERMRIESGGDVGIGETNPVQKLQVNGNIRADGHYYVGGSIVIDSSSNLTNIGSITATDLVTENNVTKDGQGPYDWVTVGAGSRAAALRINDIAGANYIIRAGGYGLRFMKHVDAGTDSFVDVMRFNATSVSDTTADVAITNNLAVGGTISSGAITSSGAIESTSLQTQNIYLSTALYTLNTAGNGWDSTINRNSGSPTANLPGGITSGNITTTGYLRGPSTFTIDPAAHGDDTGTVVIAGNLQVDGTTTTINSTTMDVDDLNITVAKGAANAAAANGAGLTVDGANAVMQYLSSADEFHFNKTIRSDVNITAAGQLSGGSLIVDTMSLNGSSITGTSNLTLDIGGDITLDADGGQTRLKDNGVEWLRFSNESAVAQIFSPVIDSDIHLVGIRNAGVVEALKLDMSDGGAATFSSKIQTGNLTVEHTQLTQSVGNLKLLTSASGGHILLEAAGNVGIGTAAPSSMLHVAGGSATIPTLSSSFPLTISNNGNSGLNIISSGTTNAGQINFGDSGDADAGRIRYDHSDNSMRFSVNATEYMRLGSIGRLAINSTALTADGLTIGTSNNNCELDLTHTSAKRYRLNSLANGKFQIENKTDSTVPISIATNNAITINSTFTFPTADGSSGQVLQTDGSGNVSWATISGGGSTVWSTSGSNIYYNSGNVGIGTSSPIAPLHVAGNAIIETGSPDLYFATTSAAHTNWRLAAQEAVSDAFEIASGTQSASSNAIADTYTTRFVVKSSGNVGIGNTNPNKPLTITSDSGANTLGLRARSADDYSFIQFFNNAGTALRGQIYSKAAGDIGFTTGTDSSAGNDLYIKNGTGVGIGTTAPNNKLTVTGGSDGINIQGTSSYLRWNSGDMMIRNEGSYAMGFHTYDGSSVQVERMRITSAGNVGIGTASPASKLHIESGNTHNKLSITSTANGGTGYDASIDLLSSAANSEVAINMGINGDADREQIKTYQSAMSFRTNNTERMRITSAGNIGIGISSPDYPFEVSSGSASNVARFKSTGHNNVHIQAGTSSLSQLLFADADDQDAGKISYEHANDALAFRVNAAERLRIDSSGNLLVGTTSAYGTTGTTINAAGLVYSSADGDRAGHFDRTTSDGEIVRFSKAGTTVGSIGSNSAGGVPVLDIATHPTSGIMRMLTSGTERMRITSGGILLVGTTSTTPGFSTTNGHAFHVGDASHMSRDGGVALVVNRGTSDGGILQFRKSGTYIGGIESRAGVVTTLLLNPASGNGAGISGGTKCIVPADEAGIIDNDISLGISTHRFKDLHLAGKAHIGHAVIDDYAVNTSATSAAQVDTFAAATFRTARYTIQITNTTDDTYHVTELLLIHDGTTPSITEYGTIYTGSAAEATFDADIVSGNVRLLATPASSDSMQFKVVRHSILV